MTERLVLPASLADERLDRVIAIAFTKSRADVSHLIERGHVSLNGEVIDRGHRRLHEGDVLEIDLSEVAPSITDSMAPLLDIDIAYEDDDVIVINKAAGVVVHPGAGHDADTLSAALLLRYPELATLASLPGASDERAGIVHRLDKETSGLMVVARSEIGFRSLSAQLREHEVARRYVALSDGTLESDSGVIDAPIGRSARTPTKMAVSQQGRAARTHYQVRERYREPIESSLLDVELETGRTHQIRVHLAAIGHGIIGDRRYGKSGAAIGLNRPFLHAGEIAFTHPSSGEPMRFVADVPADLNEALARLS